MSAPVTVTLLPCPFCGGEAAIHEWPFLGLPEDHEPEPTSYHVACAACEGGHPPTYDRAEAIAAWNTRTAAAEAASAARVAEMEAALQQAKTELLDLHSPLHDDLDAAFTRINLARMRARAKAAAEGEQP